MILIYSSEINSRIEYTFRLIFETILKVDVRVTALEHEFIISELPKLNYSPKKFGDELYMKPHPLLFEKGLGQPDIQPVMCGQGNYFFESSADSVLPFDLFAASFYLVTRYEEYLEPESDKHGRYPASKSILVEYDLLKKPVVNIWAGLLSQEIKERYPGFQFPERKFKFCSTIDIDNAWAYKHKGILRTAGAFAKAFLKGNFAEVVQRTEVIAGAAQDPYDTYDFLDSVFSGNEDKVIFFFLMGDYARYDKSIRYQNKRFRRLIHSIAGRYHAGIHPSYASGDKGGEQKIEDEKERLENITGRKIEKSRQHFVRLRFPDTYRHLINAGLRDDYSMGYPTHAGFRAGICTPYYFYDLEKEAVTSLMIWPFQVMDVTLRDYIGLSAGDALKETELLMEEVKKVGGTFVGIWHNETVADQDKWKGYRQVFVNMNRTGFKWANE